jgi:hypothetical protein
VFGVKRWRPSPSGDAHSAHDSTFGMLALLLPLVGVCVLLVRPRCA